MEATIDSFSKPNIRRRERKISFTEIGYFLITMFFVVFSDTVWFSFNANSSLVSFGQVSMCVISLCLFATYLLKSNKKDVKSLLFLIAAVLLLFVSAIYHNEFSGGYISKICLFILGFSACSLLDIRKIIKNYQIIMAMICVSSLIGFLFMNLHVSFIYSLPQVTNIGGRKFYLFLLSFVTSGTTIRNYGLFTEPSRFQAYINFSLILCLFYDKKINKKMVILFLITLLTTYSTTGFIAFFFIFIAFIFSKKTQLSLLKKIIILAASALILFIIYKTTSFFESSTTKISLGSGSESYSVRFNSIFGGLIMIKNYFLFGTGITNANQAFINATAGLYTVRETTTYTNTIIMSISKFGIIPGLYYIVNFYKTLKCFAQKQVIITLILFIAVFCMLSGISFLESIMFNIIPLFHLALDRKKVN